MRAEWKDLGLIAKDRVGYVRTLRIQGKRRADGRIEIPAFNRQGKTRITLQEGVRLGDTSINLAEVAEIMRRFDALSIGEVKIDTRICLEQLKDVAWIFETAAGSSPRKAKRRSEVIITNEELGDHPVSMERDGVEIPWGTEDDFVVRSSKEETKVISWKVNLSVFGRTPHTCRAQHVYRNIGDGMFLDSR